MQDTNVIFVKITAMKCIYLVASSLQNNRYTVAKKSKTEI